MKVAAFFFAASAGAAIATETECQASAAAFQQIQVGMTYDEAVEAVGCEAFEYQSEYDEAGSRRHMRWKGNGNPITSELGLFVQDGVIQRRSQTDLR